MLIIRQFFSCRTALTILSVSVFLFLFTGIIQAEPKDPVEIPKDNPFGDMKLLFEPCDTIICDDFEDYIQDATLDGQGIWAGSANFFLEATTTQESSLAVVHETTNDSNITGYGDMTNEGTQGMWINRTSYNGDVVVGFYEGATYSNSFYFGDDQHVHGRVTGGYFDMGTYATGTWYWVGYQWRESDHNIRWFLNDETTDLASSTWSLPNTDWTTGLDRINLRSYGLSAGDQVFFDFLYSATTVASQEEEATTSTSTSDINTPETYPQIFFFMILLFLMSFYVVTKA